MAAHLQFDAHSRVAEPTDETDPVADIAGRIRLLRGHRVLLDVDLADIYGVPVKRLRDQFRARMPAPGDFCFSPEPGELFGLGDNDPRQPGRLAFTEHGAFIAAILLKAPQAMSRSVLVVRAFVRLRDGGAVDKV